MQHRESSRTGGALRRLVLGGLFAVGAVLALAPRAEEVFAADRAAGKRAPPPGGVERV